MPESPISSSGSVTPASAHTGSCSRGSDSDTTPSPSGGNRSPTFNPNSLSEKLALLEASESLAYAAETLSIAAKAMSKAAASLASASGRRGYAYDARPYNARKSSQFTELTDKHGWQQSAYVLPSFCGTSNGGELEIGEYDEGYKLSGGLSKVANAVPTTIGKGCSSPQTDSTSHNHPNNSSISAENQTSISLSSVSELEVNYVLPVPSVEIETTETISTQPGGGPKALPSIGQQDQTLSSTADSGALSNSTSKATPKATPDVLSEAKPPTQTSTSGSTQQAPNSLNASNLPSHIILDRGFDALPAACYLATQCGKTICFYNHSNALQSVGSVFKGNSKQHTIVPDSLKTEKLLAAARKFSEASSAILIWPGSIKLSGIQGLSNSSDTQVIHVGEPSRETTAFLIAFKGMICPRVILILSKSELSCSQITNKVLTQQHVPNPNNDICNKQGAGSPLHPCRMWLRVRLADMSFARGFYWGWILHQRKRNQSRAPTEVVQLANQYAQEFLLRGNSREYGEPVGGQVSITMSDANGQKLQAAVKAGILLIA
ncbi:hypothetical protein CTheo_6899 [Ceratobasidium theobromae]|uniref:Uncharacterized protein n=1 Tax=Ceratobasidium theobromae TaxID=1582974 RepID=A0A5N5QD11_9AGAM|nr:hypothetical protein CTheo_6899 [Ceratobasidium theobromae]